MDTRNDTLRILYPPIDPANYSKVHFLRVSDLHTIWIAECGNLEGIPVIFCHGGPGAGTGPVNAQYYDPERYHIILFDQRGTRRSTPLGCLEENTTPDLVDDMEKIRQHLGIEQWLVSGRSWGSTLALLYAEKYPERVLGLILCGIFLGRNKDINIFVKNDTPASLLRPDGWADFKSNAQKLVEEAGFAWEEDNIIDLFYQLITTDNEDIKNRAASLFMQWETSISTLEDAETQMSYNLNQGIFEIHYLKHKLFIKENQILENAYKIAHIPTYIVQGKFDLICPPYQAAALAEKLHQVVRYNTVAGHVGYEQQNIHYLVKSTDDFAARYSQEHRVKARQSYGMFATSAI